MLGHDGVLLFFTSLFPREVLWEEAKGCYLAKRIGAENDGDLSNVCINCE